MAIFLRVERRKIARPCEGRTSMECQEPIANVRRRGVATDEMRSALGFVSVASSPPAPGFCPRWAGTSPATLLGGREVAKKKAARRLRRRWPRKRSPRRRLRSLKPTAGSLAALRPSLATTRKKRPAQPVGRFCFLRRWAGTGALNDTRSPPHQPEA